MKPTRISRSSRWDLGVGLRLTLGLALLLAVVTFGTGSSAGAASPAVSQPARRSSARTATVAVPGCSAFRGARSLGTSYSDGRIRVDTCGQRPSFDGARNDSGAVVRPYAGSPIYYRGYQCIELVARYLKARFDADPGVANGAQAVDRYASVYPSRFVRIANGTRGHAPRAGDVISLSGNRRFNDVGHTGIVISSSVSARGNGTFRAAEENWGGPGGTRGFHDYTVKRWHVVFVGLPHIKWLRGR